MPRQIVGFVGRALRCQHTAYLQTARKSAISDVAAEHNNAEQTRKCADFHRSNTGTVIGLHGLDRGATLAEQIRNNYIAVDTNRRGMTAMATADEPNGVEREPFGKWLMRQRDRGGFVGQLANSAAQDRTFPKAGTYEDACKWMQAQRASGDDWEALDDAETAWLAS